MKAIVAVDKNWGIGKNNDLLFSIPEDMKFFRETTKGKVVVMGANTLRSFPNGSPLKNRVNIVLSTTIKRDDCVVVDSLDKLIEEIKKYLSVFRYAEIFNIVLVNFGFSKADKRCVDRCESYFVDCYAWAYCKQCGVCTRYNIRFWIDTDTAFAD